MSKGANHYASSHFYFALSILFPILYLTTTAFTLHTSPVSGGWYSTATGRPWKGRKTEQRTVANRAIPDKLQDMGLGTHPAKPFYYNTPAISPDGDNLYPEAGCLILGLCPGCHMFVSFQEPSRLHRTNGSFRVYHQLCSERKAG